MLSQLYLKIACALSAFYFFFYITFWFTKYRDEYRVTQIMMMQKHCFVWAEIPKISLLLKYYKLRCMLLCNLSKLEKTKCPLVNFPLFCANVKKRNYHNQGKNSIYRSWDRSNQENRLLICLNDLLIIKFCIFNECY